MVLCHSSLGSSFAGIRRGEPPALLIQSVNFPNSLIAVLPNLSRSLLFVTSAVIAIAVPPTSLILCSTPLISSVLRAARITFAPAFAKSSAIPCPMPLPAPVTTATLPSRLYLSRILMRSPTLLFLLALAFL